MGIITIDSKGFSLNEATVALLELTPEQAKVLEASIRKLLDQLCVEELAHAYVSTNEKGDEQIVVPAFDRTQFIETLRADPASQLGTVIADFVNERLPYDDYLAVRNSEIRAYIEQGSDGKDREVFERTASSRVHEGQVPGFAEKVRTSGVTKFRTLSFLKDEFNFRTRHLWDAKDRLPRREESRGKI